MRVMRVPSFLAIWLFSGLALAQAIPPEVRAELGPGKEPVILVTSFGKKGSAQLHAGKGKAITLHDREAAGTVAVGQIGRAHV